MKRKQTGLFTEILSAHCFPFTSVVRNIFHQVKGTKMADVTEKMKNVGMCVLAK